MPDRRRRRVALGVFALTVFVAGGAIWFARRDQGHHAAGVFTGELPTEDAWPPVAPADLATELASTRAVKRLAATGLAPEGGFSFDAGPPLGADVPGLQVRTGVVEDLFYIEAVIGEASFDDRLPMAVLIHGRGDRARIPGGPFWGLGAPIRVIVPQAPDPLGNGFEWLPVRVGQNLTDRLTTSLLSRAGHLAVFLRTMREALPTVGKALVVGFSQGGMLTFTLAMQHSDVVEAAFPLSAWLPPALVPAYRRDDLPFPRIRGVHGLDDRIIPPGPTVEVFDTLRERGFDAEIVTFEGVPHEMSEDMNAQLHDWLQEALGVVVEQGVRDGLLDGGVPPCPPPPGWFEAGVPFDGGVPEGGLPEGGAFDAGPWPCPEIGVDGSVEADGAVPDGAIGASPDAGGGAAEASASDG